MFRRIEFIKQLSEEEYRNLRRAASERGVPFDSEPARFWKTGIMGAYPEPVLEAWRTMNAPHRALYKNCRFYFTEIGWKRFGRPTIIACQQMGTPYRVIAIKEKSVDIFYRDQVQVAVRARKEKTEER